VRRAGRGGAGAVDDAGAWPRGISSGIPSGMSSGARPDLAPDRRSLALAVVAACTLILGTFITLLGFALDIPRLSDWDANGTAVQPNTAMALLACGVALLASSRGRMRVALVLGGAIGLLSVSVGIEYTFDVDLGIDRPLLFGREWGQATTLAPGRTGPPAALSLGLLAVALVILSVAPVDGPRAHLRRWVPPLALVVLGISLFTLVGYAFGGRAFYSVPWLVASAWQSALLLVVAACGVLGAVPERDPVRMLRERSGAGMLSRLALPLLVAVPIVLAALRQTGEDLRLYDEGTGRALSVVLTIGSSAGLMWWALTALRRREQRERERTEIVSATLESLTDGFLRLDAEWRMVYANAEAERLSGVHRRELLGRTLQEVFPGVVGSAFEREYARAMREKQPVALEEYYAAADRWASAKAYPMPDGGLTICFQDVTPRREAEKALRDRTALLRAVSETTSELIFVKDREARLTFANPAVLSVLGVDEARAIGSDLSDIIADSGEVATIHETDLRIMVSGSAETVEERLTRHDGSRFFQSTKQPLRDEAGQVVGIIGVARDITDRKHAEQLEHEQTLALQMVATGRSMGDCLVGLTEAVARLEPGLRACVRLAHASSTAEVETFSAHLPASPSEEWPESVRACCVMPVLGDRGRAIASFVLCLSEAREPTEWELRIAAFGAHLAGIAIEARLAERAVRQSEERFRSLVSVIADVPWTSDAEGCFVALQPAWARFTGQSFPMHAGLGWADALHPSDRERVVAARRQSCESKTLFRSSGRLWHAGTQAYRHVEVRATPVLDEDGSVREWVGTCTDVHERIHAEQELRDANRRKDEFLATLAHELRNPLSPVRSGLDVLRHADSDPVARARVVDMMERQVSHMVRLVDDLLEVSRITRGKIELRKEVVDMAAVVRSALETAGPAIETGRHRLVVELPSDSLSLEGDPVRLTQIVANLLSNAAKYTDEGGEIRVSVLREADAAVISVRDTGIGIPAEMLPRVFDLFTQVDRTLGRAQGGLGIGLALVERLVQMHGGSVQAKSEGAGRGSEFIVRLPIARGGVRVPVAPGRPAASTPCTAPLPSRSVLVVDDNRDAADSLAILFGALGRDVHTAYDGPSGLAAVRALRPAVVFLDIGMPGMDGYEVAAEVRRDPELHDVTLVALTGWGSEEDRRRSRDAGFDHHLVKPVDVDTLENVLAGVERARDERGSTALRSSRTPGMENITSTRS
jgi:PAS domain S-box-containing protein